MTCSPVDPPPRPAPALSVALAACWPRRRRPRIFPITPRSAPRRSRWRRPACPCPSWRPNAPDNYTVKRGDTLWAIAGMFLRSPWRWPELWGMNIQEVRNPHRIYPGQQLYLDKSGGRAACACAGRPPARRRPTPCACRRARASNRWPIVACPTLQPHLIEPFLTEPIIVEEDTLRGAPRIVAAPRKPRADHPGRPGLRPRPGGDAAGRNQARPHRRVPRVPRRQAAARPGHQAPSWATKPSTWARRELVRSESIRAGAHQQRWQRDP